MLKSKYVRMFVCVFCDVGHPYKFINFILQGYVYLVSYFLNRGSNYIFGYFDIYY